MGSSTQIYKVTINNSYAAGAAPSNGFLDTTKLETYYTSATALGLETTPTSNTLLTATGNRRANLRFRHMLETLNLIGNCYLIPTSTVTNATAITEGTSFVFQLLIERGVNSLSTWDETSPGSTLTGTAALIRGLARGLSTDYQTSNYIFDPTSSTSTGLGASVSVPRMGPRVGPLDVGAYAPSLAGAEGCISLALLAG